MIFHQLFDSESSTYTYLLGDEQSREAVLIDPVLELVERDLKLVGELGLKLVYVLDTHVHADHVTAAGAIRDRFAGAIRTGVGRGAGVECSDIPLDDGQILKMGRHEIRVIGTPGHTDSCMSFFIQPETGSAVVFTGDALLIRGTGRTDFQNGSSSTLFDSVTLKLFMLPDDTRVYPAHDYRGQTSSTIGAEKQHNPRLGKGRSREEFTKLMSELDLALPKKIHEAVPANMSCGKKDSKGKNMSQGVFLARTENGIPEITPEDLSSAMKTADWKSKGVRLVDVRRPDEYVGEFGHVDGAELVTLGPDLQTWIDNGNPKDEVVFICRSGGRSGQATEYAKQKGYDKAFNMRGGMIRWSELNLPAVKA